MAKSKSVWFCKECGHESAKWLGKCPSCGQWNSFTEEIVVSSKGAPGRISVLSGKSSKPSKLSEISNETFARIDTSIGEFNRVLGGGLVPGSMVLLGGEPGIGKSTLALQLAMKSPSRKVLYVSGEESPQQIRQRADRLGLGNEECLIYCETDLDAIIKQMDEVNPDIVIVDSIQTLQTEILESSAGTVSQVRECAAALLRKAKGGNIPVILIGHINKDGNLAGPKVLEHIVDAVLQFEGDQNYLYRMLRSVKNRFGSTNELGIFEMREKGLLEVSNPSEILISHIDEQLSGVAVAATVDGIRPMLIEVQALVSSAAYGNPQRITTGFDVKRLNMLLAVLERRAGFKLASKDVFLNMAGGIRIIDPAADMAIVTCILSSAFDIEINKRTCFSAEIGLSGEIRPVSRIEQRIAEAEKTGFRKIYVSRYNLKGIDMNRFNIEIHPVSRLDELTRSLFSKASD